MRCFNYQYSQKVASLPRDAMNKLGLCRRAVFVCPSRSCILSKRINISSKNFSPSSSHTTLVFPHQTVWQHSDTDLLTEVLKNRDFRPVYLFISKTIQDRAIGANRKPYQAFEWYQFQRSWVTLSDLVKYWMTQSIARQLSFLFIFLSPCRRLPWR